MPDEPGSARPPRRAVRTTPDQPTTTLTPDPAGMTAIPAVDPPDLGGSRTSFMDFEKDPDITEDARDAAFELDEDCRFAAKYDALRLPTWRAASFDVEPVVVMGGRLAEIHDLHLEIIGPAVTTLAGDVLSGRRDLCDDELVDALYCRQARVRTGEFPSFGEVATVVARVLGLPSPLTSVPPSPGPAWLRSEMHTAALTSCDPERVGCAVLRLKALTRAYLDVLCESLNDGSRNLVHRATLSYTYDTRLLRHDSVRAAFGSRCGSSALAVGHVILGLPVRQAQSYARRWEMWQKFNEMLLLPPGSAEADVERVVSEYLVSSLGQELRSQYGRGVASAPASSHEPYAPVR